MENKKIPRIKITESPNEWTSLPFDEVFLTLPNNTLSRAELTANDGIAKNIHYGDVLVKYGEHIDTSVEALPYISNAKVVSAFERSKLANGDVVIADTAEDETAGKCVEINGIKDDEIILSGLHTILCRPIIKFAQGYLGYYMNSPAYHKQLIPLMQGTKVTSISREALKETNISFPSNVEEQANIVRYLDGLSDSIEICSLRHTKLLALKKSLLQKMFPQEGESVPQIRFEGFEGEWDKKKLGTIAKEIVRKDASSHAPVMMISAASGFIYQSDRYSTNNAGQSLPNYTVLRKNELAYNHGFSNLRPFGSCFNLKIEEARVPFVYHCFSVSDNNSAFISMELNSYFVEQQLRKLVSSTARMDGLLNISFEDYATVEIFIPHIDEQQKIADYFDNLDTLIESQEQKIKKLQQMKMALLQKMFV